MLEYEGWWRGYILSKVISLTWKLDPADIGLPLIIVHAVWGKLSSVYIRIVYCMTTMCMYILKLIITHYNIYVLYIHTVERQSCNYSPSGLVVMFTLYLNIESPTVHVS